MLSMTGYGRGEYVQGGIELTVEIKTVNNRYLDVSVKSPRTLFACDDLVRSAIREKLTRGHADVYISIADKREKKKKLYLDEELALAYADAAKRIKFICPDAQNDFSITSILRYPEILKSEENAVADDECIDALSKALSLGLDKLNAMRENEGKKLADDMLNRVEAIEEMVASIEARAPMVVKNYQAKLEAKIKKLLDGIEADEGRLLSEVALFADKSNIDEELTRLRSHISQFRQISQEKLVGRKLDFLVQEFNREANTICSKSNDVEITRVGLAMKNEIEKIREQVQNVE